MSKKGEEWGEFPSRKYFFFWHSLLVSFASLTFLETPATHAIYECVINTTVNKMEFSVPCIFHYSFLQKLSLSLINFQATQT